MDTHLPKRLIISFSLIQSIVLTLLYRSAEHEFWPGTSPVWLFSLVTFFISFPLLVSLCITKTNLKDTIKFLLPFSITLSLLGAYVGFQQEPKAFINNSSIISVFIFTALIACFKVLMYVQQYIDNKKFSYSSLVELSWQNFIVFSFSCLFIGALWGILNLGASLFAVLEINFFKELLEKDWFVIPVLNIAFGFAVFIFRKIIHTVETVSTMLQTLLNFMLPTLTVISLGFLVTLPFTGLSSLWKTGSGSLLILWLQALTLFCVNAVYQYGSGHKPYSPLIHRLIFIGVALLPIYSLISAYGLWLRIEQYGLTVDRCWAILVWSVLTSFSFGYLIGIIKKRDAWLETLGSVNIAMGFFVLTLMLLVNSPVLNFQQISANSQIARLDEGKVNFEEFDYYYFGYALGRQGYLKLQTLINESKTLPKEHIAIIERMYINHKLANKNRSFTNFESLITYWPSKESIPADLVKSFYERETQYEWSIYQTKDYYLIAIDLDDDTKPEFIAIEESNELTNADMWVIEHGQWVAKYMTTSNPGKDNYIKELIKSGQIETVKPKWKNIKIGNLELKSPND